MATDVAHAGHAPDRLANFPVAFFASVMGLSGLTLAWMKAGHVLALGDSPLPPALALLSAVAFAVLLGVYAAKIVLRGAQVAEEYHHPVRLHFLPTISISILLLSIVALGVWPSAAAPLFFVGAPLHLAMTLLVLNSWFSRDHFQTAHLSPAWFIPIVGNVLVPLSGVPLGYVELSWFFFAIGIVFWLVLFAIIINRVLFHNPLPERLAPTLFILIAPPAVGFLSYVKLTGGVDAAARILYYFALFMTLFLLTQGPRLLRARFYLSWWAYSFPLAAITVASLTMYEKIGGATFHAVSVGLLTLATIVVSGLFARTLLAIGRHEICLPEH